MLKIDHKKAQAATELAVFGAILIFLIGTIVRSAVGNSMTQDQNFQAMRQAMLLSWTCSGGSSCTAPPQGEAAVASTSRNSASIIMLEDRLSPDIGKFGDLDRSPYIATGQGTFTYELQYPIDPSEVPNNLPIQDVYINAQHFPFTNASYVPNLPLIWSSTASCSTGSNQCEKQKCLRNAREWVSDPAITAGAFVGIAPIAPVTAITQQCQDFLYIPGVRSDLPNGESPTQCQSNANDVSNATDIFNKLAEFGAISAPGGGTSGTVLWTGSTASTLAFLPSSFTGWYHAYFSNAPFSNTPQSEQTQLGMIENVLTTKANYHYKLFYTRIANSGFGSGLFSATPPAVCATPPCPNNELNSTVQVLDYQRNKYTNTNGDMQYDLSRLGNYSSNAAIPSTPIVPAGVENVTQFPSTDTNGSKETCSAGSVPNMRCYVAWQWAASAGTTAAAIGLVVADHVYPSYDIVGRLKEQTIYGISQDSGGNTTVTYEDNQGGDIDTTWDQTSCGSKPGIQPNAQVFTFTQNGTYLSIQEGKLLNPETNQVVRSVNRRDTIDLVQRIVQLSNNTGRFCNAPPYPIGKCTGTYGPCAVPNDVEVCVDSRTACTDSTKDTCSCFSADNIAKTCYDRGDMLLFVRSRLQDLRGHFWMTGTSGQLKVQ